MKRTQATPAERAYWYRFHVGECPVCGRDQGWKERVQGEKPTDMRDRYVQLTHQETYDHCDI